MDIGVIAKRYAKALLLYAKDSKSEDTVYAEMLRLIGNYHQLPQITEVLHNPLLPHSEKVAVICEAAADTDPSPVLQRFATLVVAHHRESLMLFIAHSYKQLYRQLKQISVGHLITATPVSDKIKQRLEAWIAAESKASTELILDTQVDPDLLGGFIFQIDDLRLDASVATQFEQIKKQFIEKNKRII